MWQAGGGGGGRFYRNDDVTISPGPQTVTVGAGGKGGIMLIQVLVKKDIKEVILFSTVLR